MSVSASVIKAAKLTGYMDEPLSVEDMNRCAKAWVDEQCGIRGLHDGDVAADGAPVGEHDMRSDNGAMPQRAILA